MQTSRRLLAGLAVGVAAWAGAGCGSDVSVAADPAPAVAEAPSPVATLDVPVEDVDTPGGDEAAVDTASTVVPVRSRGQQSAPGHTDQSTYMSIRDVDFMNGFTFSTDLDFGSPDVTVEDGSFANGEFGDPDYYWFGVNHVNFGDLDGDGIEEAVLVTTWNGGGTGYFDSVRAFRLVEGVVEPAGVVPFGDRADGGVFDVRIEEGTTFVWSFSTTLGACCPNQISRSTLVLGEHWLAWADRGPTRTWFSFNHGGENNEVTFLPGTSSAMVAMYGYETNGVFTFEAARDQRLTITVTDGPVPTDISVTALATGQVMPGIDGMVLPADGYYEVEVSFDDERDDRTTLDVAITSGEPAPAVTWTPAVEQTLVTEEPYVSSSLVWPVFESSQPGTAAANDALAAFVSELDDYWLEDVTEFSEPQDDSSYDLSYEVTLATSDLVSVRFDFYDYVCCRPYPNYGPRAAVLDLASGRLLPVSEIVDTNRLDEINALWISELDAQGLLPDAAQLLGQAPQFDSLTLRPEGIELGTERNSLGGGLPGTVTTLTYAELGDLVNPALVARITAG